MKQRSSDHLPLIHPESLRQPLLEALSDFFISAWTEPDQAVDAFVASLERAVDLLLRGVSRVPLDAAPAGLVEVLRNRSMQIAERTISGTRVRPENGYGLRMAIAGDRVGVILQIEVTASRAGDQALAFVRIAAIFSPEEFKAAAKAVRAYELRMEGVSAEVVKDLVAKAPVVDQTLDYDLDFNPGAPAPKF